MRGLKGERGAVCVDAVRDGGEFGREERPEGGYLDDEGEEEEDETDYVLRDGLRRGKSSKKNRRKRTGRLSTEGLPTWTRAPPSKSTAGLLPIVYGRRAAKGKRMKSTAARGEGNLGREEKYFCGTGTGSESPMMLLTTGQRTDEGDSTPTRRRRARSLQKRTMAKM